MVKIKKKQQREMGLLFSVKFLVVIRHGIIDLNNTIGIGM